MVGQKVVRPLMYHYWYHHCNANDSDNDNDSYIYTFTLALMMTMPTQTQERKKQEEAKLGKVSLFNFFRVADSAPQDSKVGPKEEEA